MTRLVLLRDNAYVENGCGQIIPLPMTMCRWESVLDIVLYVVSMLRCVYGVLLYI